MQDFVFFLGRFHVLALHLPIGIILAALALDWTARRPAYRQLAVLSPFLWALAAASAVLTVVLGYMHFAEGAFSGAIGNAHRFFGTSVAVICVAIWWLSRRPELYRRINVVTGVVALAAVTAAGHFGGELTHGSAFLSQYAPGPLRALLGGTAARPPVTSVAAADPYLDVVHPLLERRCMTCHNADKRENGFSMATYESTLAGGDTGHAIVPGKADSSELYRRINLAHDDEEFMPAEGKTPLTADQAKILRWWIDAGAPHGTTVGETGVEPEIQALIASELGLGGKAAQNGAEVSPVAADAAVVDRLYRAGFLVRQVSQSDAHLVVSVYSPGARIVADQMAVLLTAADQIVELDLQDAGLEDESLNDIGNFAELTRLRLSHNALTDRAIARLASLPRLERLNLYANPGITDARVEALVRLATLRRLDMWQTGVSAAGLARLRQLRPDLDVQGQTATVLADAAIAAPAP
jgi:Planctomycete cytochrome C